MRIIETASLSETQKVAVLQLWNEEYPGQLRYAQPAGFDAYLSALTDKTHLLAVNDEGQVLGWALSFIRDGERWFAIIIHRSMQGMGEGSALLNALKSKEQSLAGWATDHERYTKADGSPYPSPLGFYVRQGFTTNPESRLELPHLSAVRIDWLPDASVDQQ